MLPDSQRPSNGMWFNPPTKAPFPLPQLPSMDKIVTLGIFSSALYRCVFIGGCVVYAIAMLKNRVRDHKCAATIQLHAMQEVWELFQLEDDVSVSQDTAIIGFSTWYWYPHLGGLRQLFLIYEPQFVTASASSVTGTCCLYHRGGQWGIYAVSVCGAQVCVVHWCMTILDGSQGTYITII